MRVLFLIVVGVAAGFVMAQEKNNLKQRVESLLKQLGNEDWMKRQEAEKKLMGMGFEAGDILWEHMKGEKDAEVRARIEKILEKMGYVPKKYRGRFMELFSQLKSGDPLKTETAYKRLCGLALVDEKVKKWLKRYAEKFLLFPTASSVSAELKLENRIIRSYAMPKIKVTIKNNNDKPVWVPLQFRVELTTEIGSGIHTRYLYTTVRIGKLAIPRGSSRLFGMLLLQPGKSLEVELITTYYSGSGTSQVPVRDQKFEFGEKLKSYLAVRARANKYLETPFPLPLCATIYLMKSVVVLPSGMARYDITAGFLCPPKCEAGSKINVRYVLSARGRFGAGILNQYANTKVLVVATDGKYIFVLGDLKLERRGNNLVAEGDVPSPKKPGKYMVWGIAVKGIISSADYVLQVLPKKKSAEPQQKK